MKSKPKEKKMKPFVKTSVMHRDIGEHEHEVSIYESYHTYAVCNKCGMHDWSLPKEGKNVSEDDFSHKEVIDHFKKKYPKHKVVDLLSEL